MTPFTTCSKLKVLEIPASVQTIGPNAFANCPLTNLALPSFTQEQVLANKTTWAIKAGCVVACSDGNVTIP